MEELRSQNGKQGNMGKSMYKYKRGYEEKVKNLMVWWKSLCSYMNNSNTRRNSYKKLYHPKSQIHMQNKIFNHYQRMSSMIRYH